MKLGQRVTYKPPRGNPIAATVTAVPDTGPSGAKILNLSFEGGELLGVVHAGDRVSGHGYWLLESETDEPPERRADDDEQLKKLAEAEAAETLPRVDRRGEDELD